MYREKQKINSDKLKGKKLKKALSFLIKVFCLIYFFGEMQQINIINDTKINNGFQPCCKLPQFP